MAWLSGAKNLFFGFYVSMVIWFVIIKKGEIVDPNLM